MLHSIKRLYLSENEHKLKTHKGASDYWLIGKLGEGMGDWKKDKEGDVNSEVSLTYPVISDCKD